ncbi:ESX-1 secretion-associated protein EspI-like [Acomys russatus]|uniref:ESX-1 secretion-associated protein EspI-like n=1 Tax=Acomys russatus TaxID=60746 RepID=UPI0021E291D6|nr:ESX-1 secretion-associated protein EspI-like [Acomys russatus]
MAPRHFRPWPAASKVRGGRDSAARVSRGASEQPRTQRLESRTRTTPGWGANPTLPPRRPNTQRARAQTHRPRARSRPPTPNPYHDAHAHTPALPRSPSRLPTHPPTPSEAWLPDARPPQPLGARPTEPAAALTSSAPGPPRRTLPPLACLADGGSGGSGDSDPGVRGTGAQAGSDLPGRFRSRLSLSSSPPPARTATASSPL